MDNMYTVIYLPVPYYLSFKRNYFSSSHFLFNKIYITYRYSTTYNEFNFCDKSG